nr:hypothetical protein [Tanacetum cinerariifolium]
DDLDTMSLDDVYNHLKIYEPEVQKKSESNSQNMAFISSSNTSSRKGDVPTTSVPTASIQVSTASTDVAAASLSHDTVCAYIASQSNGSQIKYEDITHIDEDDIEEMDIKYNMALLSMGADREIYKITLMIKDIRIVVALHMTRNLSYLSEYKHYDGGYVSFGHRGGKITADQVKHAVSLTMESKIPTVSSPVPTICLDISPKSSSGLRLITKGDFSQKETPSLGNALTLSNRFEDTFEVEADLSNMETSILISPTPTFRIHKDHPKSQIIGPVDTPVQTKHKSQEIKEQTFIAIIHQNTNPKLLQFYLFLCFLSQEEPKNF